MYVPIGEAGVKTLRRLCKLYFSHTLRSRLKAVEEFSTVEGIKNACNMGVKTIRRNNCFISE
jgi:hypothetical protein